VFAIVGGWNDLYWPLIVILSPEMAPPALGMTYAISDGNTDLGALMAAATLLTLPLMAVFLFAQTHFIRGLTMTGLK